MQQNKEELIIRTVTGDIDPKDLGICDCHGHTLVTAKHTRETMPQYIMDDYRVVLSELKDFQKSGGKSFTELSPIGEGRPTADLVHFAKDTGLNIIASTGFHVEAFYEKGHWSFSKTEKELTDLFITELTQGMYVYTEEAHAAPDIMITAKAGLIKTGCDDAEISELDKKRFRAAVNASLQTGASIHVHTASYFKQNAIMLAKALLEMGMDPQSLIIAHVDSCFLPSEEYDFLVAELGVFIDFDCFSNPHSGMEALIARRKESTIPRIKKIVDKGYGKQIMVGSDILRPGFKISGGDGFDFIPGKFRQMLLEAGLTEAQVEDILMNNPTRAHTMKKC